MSKSQLRRLANEYAAGRLDAHDYVRKRSDLIDAIVAGEVGVESSPDSTAEFSVSSTIERRIRTAPLPLIIGACVVIAIIWLLFAARQPDTPVAEVQNAPDSPTGLRVMAAKGLVEEFLTTRDWSGESLARFRDHWNALTPNEQAQARAAPWFRRLAEALREEINAHKALAEFDGSGLSTTTGRRLEGFGEFLGIDAEIPEVPIADRLVAETAPEPGVQTSSQWLAAQADDHYTLQLFAVDHLDRLEHLIASHPEVALQLLSFEGQEPRFRLIYGSFASEEQARHALESLPAELRGQSSGPFVRRIGQMREEQRRVQAEARTTEPLEDQTKFSADSADPATAYTLQVFASTNRENVDRLVARYQALDLRIYVSEGDSTPYRVLYGEFDSPQAARQASEKLPKTMLEEMGKPLLRESSEFP